jgi:hypothetical protein
MCKCVYRANTDDGREVITDKIQRLRMLFLYCLIKGKFNITIFMIYFLILGYCNDAVSILKLISTTGCIGEVNNCSIDYVTGTSGVWSYVGFMNYRIHLGKECGWSVGKFPEM